MKLWVKIGIALILGIIAGSLLGEKAVYLKPIGDIFLQLIKMIIVPLVLASMTVGITSIHDPKKLGRVGLKTLGIFLFTTVISIALGLTLSWLFQPGEGLEMVVSQGATIQEPPTLSKILLDIVPGNPIKAMVDNNYLQIIVFAIFLGIAINFSGDKGRTLLDFFESLADVMYRLTSIVMEFSPIGVFAMIAGVVGESGISKLFGLMKYLGVFYLGCLIHILAVFVPIIWVGARLNPKPFFRGLGDAMMVAFSTASSSATLPVTMHCVQKNLGVSKNITSFIIPLGSTINMNGMGIFQGVSIFFIAQAYGVELTFQNILMVLVLSTLSAIGAAGIPGSGIVMLQLMTVAINLPVEAVTYLFAVDRIREMGSTVLNVMGDAVSAVYVAKSEGELDERQYYHEDLVELEGSDV